MHDQARPLISHKKQEVRITLPVLFLAFSVFILPQIFTCFKYNVNVVAHSLLF